VPGPSRQGIDGLAQLAYAPGLEAPSPLIAAARRDEDPKTGYMTMGPISWVGRTTGQRVNQRIA
jgi:hypothetical protein